MERDFGKGKRMSEDTLLEESQPLFHRFEEYKGTRFVGLSEPAAALVLPPHNGHDRHASEKMCTGHIYYRFFIFHILL